MPRFPEFQISDSSGADRSATASPTCARPTEYPKVRFVARLLEGEKMAVLCREFEIFPDIANSRASAGSRGVPHLEVRC